MYLVNLQIPVCYQFILCAIISVVRPQELNLILLKMHIVYCC